jgi:hypothetical protein
MADWRGSRPDYQPRLFMGYDQCASSANSYCSLKFFKAKASFISTDFLDPILPIIFVNLFSFFLVDLKQQPTGFKERHEI